MSFLTNFLSFPGKMAVGISSCIGIWELHAKFEQNRTGGFRNQHYTGAFLTVSFP